MTVFQKVSEKVKRIRIKAHFLKIRYPFIYESVKFLIFSFILIMLISRGIEGLNYRWQWYRLPDFITGPLISGLVITLSISAASLFLSILFGFITAVFRLSDSVTANLVSRIYLEAIRNTPLLIQLFLVYFVISPIFGIGRVLSAVLALSLFEGAYASEIIRSGIISIEKGQWEAAHSIGMNKIKTYRHIILPQALKKIIPMLASQVISLIKDSALVSTIAIYDLTMQAQVGISKTFLTFEIWFTVAGVYLLINIILSFFIRRFEITSERRQYG